MIDIYRINNHSSSSTFPFRIRVDGKTLRTIFDSTPLKFRTIKEAMDYLKTHAILNLP